MNKHLSHLLLEKLRGKTDAVIDEGELRAIAGQYKKDDLQDETKLRQLIQQLSAFAGRSISSEKEEQLLAMLKNQDSVNADLKLLSTLFKQR